MNDYNSAMVGPRLLRMLLVTCITLAASWPVSAQQAQDGGLPALSARVTTLEKSVANQQTTLTTLQGSISNLQSNVTSLQGALSSVQNSITNIQANTAGLQTSLTLLQTALNALGIRVSELEQADKRGTPVAFTKPYDVPVGKRLRIDTVSGKAIAGPASSDGLWVASAEFISGGNLAIVFFQPSVDRTSRGAMWAFHQVTTLYADGGTQVMLTSQCNNCPSAAITATGVLLDD